MVGYVIPGEVVLAANGVLVAAVVALTAIIGRVRERVARLEEWQRLAERDGG